MIGSIQLCPVRQLVVILGGLALQQVTSCGYLLLGGERERERDDGKERPEGLEYHQRTSHGQGCMEASYPCARTMTWF